MTNDTESLEARLANLIPDQLPEDEATRQALQERLMEISREFDEIAEAVEDITKAMLESYGLTEAELEQLSKTSPSEK
jgi:DNA-binding protein H-NS